MHLLDFHMAIKDKLDSICSNFFWNSNESKKKNSWIAWKKICTAKRDGGLGLVTHRLMNCVSLARLCWKLDNNSLWAANIIKDKYINNNKEPISFKKGSHLWKSIGIWWENYSHSIAWDVGNGSNISLWSDKWINGESLRSLIQGPWKKMTSP